MPQSHFTVDYNPVLTYLGWSLNEEAMSYSWINMHGTELLKLDVLVFGHVVGCE